MDNKRVGAFIACLRKERSMTQQQLADKLNVTNKAVSKWETGEGYPEITTIPVLAEILGVTTSELLNGELNTHENNDNVSSITIINETVKYIDETTSNNNNIAVLIISAVFIFSSFVCLSVNYLMNHLFSWSLYPTGALFFLWATIIPMIKIKKYKPWGLLFVLTITLIPFLFFIQYLVPAKGWVIPLALPIAILSLLTFGIVLLIFKTKINRLYGTAITVFLFGVVVNFGVNKIVENFLKETIENNVYGVTTMLVSVFLTLVLIVFGYIRSKRE